MAATRHAEARSLGVHGADEASVLKAAAAAESRGWAISEQKDSDFVKELGAKGMKVSQPSESLRKELIAIGDTMTGDWLKTSGAEGQGIVDAFRKK